MVDLQRTYNKLSLCHELKTKKKCIYCYSLNTKKNGKIYSNCLNIRGSTRRSNQRYFCLDCNKSFCYQRKKRIFEALKQKALNDYITTKSSLREVANRYHIGKDTILKYANSICHQYSYDNKNINKKNLSGVIQIDGKFVKIKGKQHCLLLACDGHSGQLLRYQLFTKENKNSATIFLKELKNAYPIRVKAILSDAGRGRCFIKVVENLFPGTIHQLCVVHYLRHLNLFLPRTKQSQFYFRNLMLKKLINRILLSKKRTVSLYWLERFKKILPFFRASYHKRFIRSLLNNYDRLTYHLEHDYLTYNTNVIENHNRQINRKLKNMDGFKNYQSANNFFTLFFNFNTFFHFNSHT